MTLEFSRPAETPDHRLGELIDVIGTIGLRDRENRTKDILGRASSQNCTPSSRVREPGSRYPR